MLSLLLMKLVDKVYTIRPTSKVSHNNLFMQFLVRKRTKNPTSVRKDNTTVETHIEQADSVENVDTKDDVNDSDTSNTDVVGTNNTETDSLKTDADGEDYLETDSGISTDLSTTKKGSSDWTENTETGCVEI